MDKVSVSNGTETFPKSILETSAVRPTWQHKTEEKEGGGETTQSERSTKGDGKSKGDPRCLPALVSELR